MKIAITGATGQLGQLVIQSLQHLQSSHDIVALVRNPEKAAHLFGTTPIEIRHFDYDQPEYLSRALEGIDKLLLISANDIGRRTPQHRAVIAAAQQAGVQYLLYTSLLNADQSPLGLAAEHRETENLIKQSGLNYTLLRNNWYVENYLTALPEIITGGVLYGAADDGKISAASRQDYAEAAAMVLNSTDSIHINQTYELAASQAFTLSQLAQTIQDISGKAIRFQNLSGEDYRVGLTQVGLPASLVEVIVDADVQAKQGALFTERHDLEQLLGHPTTPLTTTILSLLP